MRRHGWDLSPPLPQRSWGLQCAGPYEVVSKSEDRRYLVTTVITAHILSKSLSTVTEDTGSGERWLGMSLESRPENEYSERAWE